MGKSIAGFKLLDDDGFFSMALLREVLAEVLGTFFLIFLGCGGVQGATVDLPENTKLGSAGIIQIAIAFGLGIGGAVHLFSDISGGQFNPAVSFGLFFARKLSLYRAVILSVAQLIGGFIAAGILKCLFGNCPGAVEMRDTISPGQGLLLEFFGTLFLVLTVLATTNANRGHSPGYLQPLSIGIAIFVPHMFLVPLTGCGINPTRSLVTNAVENKILSNFYAYIVGPLLASLVGGILYEFLFDPHYKPQTYHAPSNEHTPLNGEPDHELKPDEEQA